MVTPTATNLMTSLVLEDHLLLLAEVEHVIHEENRLLKHTGFPPDAAFIRRKARLLPRLDLSLRLLRNEAKPHGSAAPATAFMGEALRTLHRLLLLDRENEGLLLRCALHNGAVPAGRLELGARAD